MQNLHLFYSIDSSHSQATANAKEYGRTGPGVKDCNAFMTLIGRGVVHSTEI